MLVALLTWLIYVAIGAVVVWLVVYLIDAYLPIPASIKNILRTVLWVVFAILCVIWLLPIVSAIDSSLPALK